MKTKTIKSKLSKGTTSVTQVHLSLTASNVLTVVESIKRKKGKKKKQKEDAAKKKEEVTKLFMACKLQCNCGDINCKAFGLKQCLTQYNEVHLQQYKLQSKWKKSRNDFISSC